MAGAIVAAALGVVRLSSPTSSVDASPPLPTASTDTTFAAGSYIIDLGASRTKPNGLRPYGLVYDLIVKRQTPVVWAIKDGKSGGLSGINPATADSDFTALVQVDRAGASGVSKSYRSGAFIVPAEYVNASVTAAVASFDATTVVDVATAPFTAPKFDTLTYWPRAVLDAQNGSLAVPYFTNAGIPNEARAYSFKSPSQLNACDDLYVMPHADPTWATHSNLLAFNELGGYIWAACHAASVLEELSNPADPAQRMNFLTADGLVNYGDHSAGTPPYSYSADGSDPVMQLQGALDTATQNGSEQIYLPKPGGWRPTTKNLVWDPTQEDVPLPVAEHDEARVVTYGRGFGDPTNGLVMYEAGHSHNKGSVGDVPAQRAFFNFLLLDGIERSPEVAFTSPGTMGAGETVTLTADISGGRPTYSYTWSSSCGGTFGTVSGVATTDPSTITTTFTAPVIGTSSNCNIRLLLVDGCSRIVFGIDNTIVAPVADVSVVKSVDQAVVAAGSTLQYTLDVANAGPAAADALVVTDTLPAGASFVSATPAPTAVLGSTLMWNLGTQASGWSTQITVDVTADTAGTSLVNEASVSTTTADPDATNDTSSVSTQVTSSGIQVVKTADPALVPAAGGSVTYTYAVTNTGDNPLHDVTVTDNPTCAATWDPAGDVNGNELLDPAAGGSGGEVWTYTCTRVVDGTTDDVSTAYDGSGDFPTDPLPGTTQNVVKVEALDAADAPISAMAAASVTVAAPSVTVTKALDPVDQEPAPGEAATFAITVTNDGNVPLTGVSTDDVWPGDCSVAAAPDLAVGETYSYACDAATPLTAVGSSTNSVTAAASDPFGDPVTDTATVDVPVGAPALQVDKSADAASVHAGDTFTYTVTVTNTSAAQQTGITVTDELPSGLTLDGTVQVTKPAAGVTVASDDFGSGAGEQTYAQGSGWDGDWTETDDDDSATSGLVQVSTADGNPVNTLFIDRLTGPVSVQRTLSLGAFTAATLTFDCSRENNFTTAVVDITLAGELLYTVDAGTPLSECGTGDGGSWGTVSVAVPPAALVDGAELQVSVPSVGRRIYIDNVSVTGTSMETVDAGAPADLTSAGGPYALDDGQSLTFTIPVLVTGEPADGLQFSNIARATSAEEPAPVAAATSTAYLAPDMTMTKTASETQVNGSGTVTYTIELRNTGNVALTPVDVSDPDCDTPVSGPSGDDGDGELDTAEVWTYTCDRDVSAAQVGDEPVDVPNTAAATFADPAGATVDRTADAHVAVVHPALIVTAVPPVATVHPGDTVTYEYTVENTGDVALLDPVVDAASCAPVTFVSGDDDADGVLDVSESWLYGCTSDPIAATTVAQDVTATATDAVFGSQVTDAAAVDVTVINPSIEVTIVADDAVSSASGDDITVGSDNDITYTYVVTNTGDVRLTDIAPFDDACDPLVYDSGDIGDPDVLEPAEQWTFTCSGGTLAATTVDHVVATGSYSEGGLFGSVASAEVTAQVRVMTPGLQILKQVTTQYVRVGADVRYLYTVTNTGETAFPAVAIADPVDDTCAPVEYLDGDDGNGDLDPGEVWTYDCTTPVVEDTLNTFTYPDPVDELGSYYTPVPGVEKVFAVDPGITVTKEAETSVDGPGTDVLGVTGDPVTYTITVTGSAGESTSAASMNAVSLEVTDDTCDSTVDLTGGDDDGNGLLDPNETWTYTCELSALPAGDPTVNTVTVVAQVASRVLDVNGDPVDPNDGLDDMTATATATVTPATTALTLTKTADPMEVAAEGDTITYSFDVENTGNAAVTDVTVSDPLLPDLSCDAVAELLPGDAVALTCTGDVYDVTQDDVDAGSIENTATVDGVTPDGSSVSDDDSVSVTVSGQPGLTLTKTADPLTFEAVDDVITYTFDVANTGDTTLTDVTVTDPLLPDLVCDPVTELLPDDSATVSCTGNEYTVTQADLNAGDVQNTAVAEGTDANGDPVSDEDSVTVEADQQPELTLTKTADPMYVSAEGDTITYTFDVENTGNVWLTDVEITDPLLPDLDCEPIAELVPGDAVTLTCTGDTYDVTADDLDLATIDNTATVEGLDPLGEPVTAEGSVSVETGRGELTLTKSADLASVSAVGDVITYTFDVENTGTVPLTDVAVSDPMLEQLECEPVPELLPGDSITLDCTDATYEVTQDDLDAGTVENTATATAAGHDGEPLADDDSVSVDVDEHPEITLVKDLIGNDDEDGSQSVTRDDTLHYVLVATNAGNVSIDNVVVADPLTGATELCAVLPPLGTCQVETTYVVLQSDVDAGTVSNVATATGDAPGLNPGGPVQPMQATDAASTPVDQVAAPPPLSRPGLRISKVAAPGTFDSIGDRIDYTIVVTNTGGTNLTQVTVTDPNADAGSVSCTPSSPAALAAGEAMTCSATHTITQSDLNAGSVRNTATARATAPSGSTIQSSDSVRTSTDSQPGITLDKVLSANADEDASGDVTLGDTLTFTLTATNSGNVTLLGVIVTDELTGDTTTCSILMPGATCELTATYVVTDADVSAGSVVNAGVVTSTSALDGSNVDGSDTTTVDVGGGGDGGGSLPVTGGTVGTVVRLAALLLLLGTGVVLITRRRRTT